jgi:hypothetical protein
MKTILLAIALASTLVSGAMAQTADPSIPPRDPPFGKGNADNDTFHQPYSATRNAYGYSDQFMVPGYSPRAARAHRQWQ